MPATPSYSCRVQLLLVTPVRWCAVVWCGVVWCGVYLTGLCGPGPRAAVCSAHTCSHQPAALEIAPPPRSRTADPPTTPHHRPVRTTPPGAQCRAASGRTPRSCAALRTAKQFISPHCLRTAFSRRGGGEGAHLAASSLLFLGVVAPRLFKATTTIVSTRMKVLVGWQLRKRASRTDLPGQRGPDCGMDPRKSSSKGRALEAVEAAAAATRRC
jgi:hypothetical protein